MKLGLTYIDSGALYRAVTWHLLASHGRLDASLDFSGDLSSIELAQDFLPDGSSITRVNGRDVSLDIRDETITRNIGIDHLRKVQRHRRHTERAAERIPTETRPAEAPSPCSNSRSPRTPAT